MSSFHTLASMAEACVSMHDLKLIHARAIISGLRHNTFVLAKILRFAAVSPLGDLEYARHLFDQMPQPNTFFYNTLIRGYSKSFSPWESVSLYNRMRRNGVEPDGFTFTFLIKGRSRMRIECSRMIAAADEIHGMSLKLGFGSYLFVNNALIHLYAGRGLPAATQRVFEETVGPDTVSWSGLVVAHVKAGELDYARAMFERMPERDVVSWTAVISAFSQAKRASEALELFAQMRGEGVEPDEVTMVSVVSACASLGDMRTGLGIQRYVDEKGFGWMVSLNNALIDMYSKCGSMDLAWRVFDRMERKSLVTWNTMISACSSHGLAEDALNLFALMLDERVQPDAVTFLALLAAHSRKGWVDEGCRTFFAMEREYGVAPEVEHYGCVVDMLGRAGRLEETFEFITGMPVASNDKVWGALLGACRLHGDTEMGERVLRKLIELKPDEGGYYILLRDIYAEKGRQAEAYEMREVLDSGGAMKTAGSSWVQP
uniref:Pentatricopeptide repeat-containing protein n=1 Tax=Kalanchoe fedtschenkoi TaxID=63787 RepID=A0A7N0RF57_KALFE